MGIKTNFTLEYLNNYLKQNNIEIPKEANLASIFKECNKYDEKGNEVENGDDILQNNEIDMFLKKVSELGSNLRRAVFDCVKEVLKKQEEERKAETEEILNNPPARGTDDFEEKAFDYMFEKLDSMGINSLDVNISLITNIYSSLDWDLDEDFDSFVSKEEAEKFDNSETAIKYMNKDSDGNIVRTHILDWIINNYLDNVKSNEE